MCTLTWLVDDVVTGAYEVFFNRDERRTRGPERPAAEDVLGGVRCLLPRDTEFQGTWIVTNEHGVTVCLLNGYHVSLGAPRETYESRGRLVLRVAPATGLGELKATLCALDLAPYRPFVLAGFEPGAHAPRVHVWDGARLAEEHVERPVVSSSADRERALARRRETFARLERDGLDSAALAAFHRSHEHGPGADSTCMHREDAETRSLCHVRVSGERVALAHHHGPPCTHPARTELELPRVAPGRSDRRP